MSEAPQTAQVTVLGAGVVGVACAYYLAKEGLEVVVVDRREGPGLETSFANGGLVVPSMSDPWAAPGVPGHLVQWIGKEDAPLLLRLRALPGVLRWGLRFLANCTEARWREGTRITLRLASYSRDALDDLNGDLAIDHGRSDAGALRIFRDDHSLEEGMRLGELYASLGVPCRKLDRAGCVDLEPSLESAAGDILGGVHYPGDRAGDARLFTERLAVLSQALGVRFRWNTTVERLERAGDAVSAVVTDAGKITAEHVVLALGTQSARLARPLGIRLPIYPVKGYSVTLPVGKWNRAPRIPLVDLTQKMGITPLGDRLRLAGTAELDGYRTAPNPRRCDALVAAARSIYPDLPLGTDRADWAGLRPMTPDCRPLLGKTACRNLLLDTGHGALGWTLAAGSGRVISDLVAGRTPEIDLRGFTLDRFS